MPDIEKVIKGLEIHTKQNSRCVGCPYPNNGLCGDQLYHDALAMLKEQAWHLLKEDEDGLIHGLPGDDGQYLMTDGEDIWIDDYVDGVDDGVQLDSGRDIREIKAWMYMPEPPKQEGL